MKFLSLSAEYSQPFRFLVTSDDNIRYAFFVTPSGIELRNESTNTQICRWAPVDFKSKSYYIEDLNDLNNPLGFGVWNATTANAPVADYGEVLTFANGNPIDGMYHWRFQLAFPVGGGVYTRRKINAGGNWTAWAQL